MSGRDGSDPNGPTPRVPDPGRDDQPAVFLPTDPDGSADSVDPADGAAATDGGADVGAGPAGSAAASTDPVDVFPGGDLDLRTGADDCYKCTVCDTSCPVAEVDDDFPGPKFQGPEQWRLKRKADVDIDDSITGCSNCMRCDSACPSGVPLSAMHNEARGEYVREQQPTLSREYLRNRILANYRTFARLASLAPRLSNAVANSRPARWLGERLMGVTAQREFPAFATETFREWWRARGGARVENPDKRVAYFHGCYANYNTPEIGKAMVRVYERFGYEVLVPEQGCSGTPMFANGMLPDARRHAETNVAALTDAIADGADVIASCTSCSLSLRQEYPELFDVDGIDDLAAHTYEALEYLRINEDLAGTLAASGGGEGEGEDPDPDPEPGPDLDLAYHAPCHARNQGLHRQALELFSEIDGVRVEDVGDSCSGISGTYGWKSEKYDYSMEIGAEMFDHMEAADGETGLTECPTCAMQMEHGTGYETRHPLEIIDDALAADG